ncbi:MAG: arylsulfatase [Pseudomonadota bacterium]
MYENTKRIRGFHMGARLSKLVKVVLRLTAIIAMSWTVQSNAQEAHDVTEPARPLAEKSTRPNVLVVMTDDVGYAASGSFGGLIDTPAFDRLARNGLRYNNFHTTPLCSPTRAALLTGRNPHAVNMGTITEMAFSDPGYVTAIPRSAATVARVLKENGYHTSIIGKYHLVPKWELDNVGPKLHWPNQMGFDYFYGFEPSFTDQFTPELIENQNYIDTPTGDDYILDRDLADKAIHWLREVRTSGGGNPFFLYYAPGTAHAPLQALADWIARYRGKFDMGWDEARKKIFERQKALGIVPQNTVLSERDERVPPWDSLTAEEKLKHARLMEVYAAALSFADHQIGRVLSELEANGELDNTIVFYLQGDNGASPAGGAEALVNYYNALNAIPEDPEKAVQELDKLGGPETAPEIALGWANALGTPFRKWKIEARFRGGSANGLAVSWPDGISANGVIRPQFHSVADIVPTIYELAGITPPDVVDGVEQQPLTGVSMAYSLSSANEPDQLTEQYFETLGSLAMYKDGWWAAARVPYGQVMTADNLAGVDWQLFDLTSDFAQTTNIASEHPDELNKLQEAFKKTAIVNQVFPITNAHPILDRKPVTAKTGTHVFYRGAKHYSNYGFPNTISRSWTMEVKVEVPTGGASGVVVNEGGRFAGWGVIFFEGVPNFIYRSDDTPDGTLVLSTEKALEPGPHTIKISVDQKGKPVGRRETHKLTGKNEGASFALSVDGTVVARGELDTTPGNSFQFQGAAVGHSNGSALLPLYTGKFRFNGEIERIVFDLQPKVEPR